MEVVDELVQIMSSGDLPGIVDTLVKCRALVLLGYDDHGNRNDVDGYDVTGTIHGLEELDGDGIVDISPLQDEIDIKDSKTKDPTHADPHAIPCGHNVAAIANQKAQKRDEFVNAGGVETVLHTMEHYSQVADVQIVGLEILCGLAKSLSTSINAANIQTGLGLWDCGGSGAMTTTIHSTEFRSKSINRLLYTDPTSDAAIPRSQSQLHGQNNSVMVSSSSPISSSQSSSSTPHAVSLPILKQQLIACNAIQLVTSQLSIMSSHPAILTWSLLFLKMLSDQYPPACKLMLTYGCVDIVCTLMQTYTGNSNVQMQGSWILYNITSLLCDKQPSATTAVVQDQPLHVAAAPSAAAPTTYAPSASSTTWQSHHTYPNHLFSINLVSDVQNQIRASGGIQAILNTVQAYEGSASLQEINLKTLSILARRNEVNQQLIGYSADENYAISGIGLILNAMRQHHTNQGVLNAGCEALRFLAFSRENRVLIGDLDGIQVLVLVLKRMQSSSPALICQALKAVNNVTFDNDENKVETGRCGGIQLIVEIIERSRACSEIQEDGCRLLRNLGEGNDPGIEMNLKIISEVGGIHAILFAMTTHANHSGINEHCCAALLNLARSGMLSMNVNVNDVRKLVRSRLDMHGTNSEFQKFSTELFKILAGDSENLKETQDRTMPLDESGAVTHRDLSRMTSSPNAELSLGGKTRDQQGPSDASTTTTTPPRSGLKKFFSKR